jgi:hypothetical protein
LTTLPDDPVAPLRFFTLPVLQSAFFSFFFEAFSFLPFSLGTAQPW